jgi:hypothetical protein
MIYGYPGGTNRYETSYGIKLKNEIENPSLVRLKGCSPETHARADDQGPCSKIKTGR